MNGRDDFDWENERLNAKRVCKGKLIHREKEKEKITEIGRLDLSSLFKDYENDMRKKLKMDAGDGPKISLKVSYIM